MMPIGAAKFFIVAARRVLEQHRDEEAAAGVEPATIAHTSGVKERKEPRAPQRVGVAVEHVEGGDQHRDRRHGRLRRGSESVRPEQQLHERAGEPEQPHATRQ